MLEQTTHAGLRDLERGGGHRTGTTGLGADGGDAVAVRRGRERLVGAHAQGVVRDIGDRGTKHLK